MGGITIRGVPFIVVGVPSEGGVGVVGEEGGGLSTSLMIEGADGAGAGGVDGGGGGGGEGIGGAKPGGVTVETVLDVRSPPTALSIMISYGLSQGLSIGRIEGPAGRQDVRSGYRET